MTRTDVMASSRPREADTAANGERPGRPLRRLAGIPAVLLITMALVVPTAAFAAGEATSGYEQKPPPPTTTTTSTTPPPASTTPPTTTSTPTTETSPTKEETTPTSTEASPTKSSSPATASSTKKASTLPFTGFDLRWSIGLGLLLMCAGFSIVATQRRQRRHDGR